MLFTHTNLVTPQGVRTDCCLAIREGKIDAIAPSLLPFPEEEVRDGQTLLFLPGLVNTHCHISMTLLRGLTDHLPLSRWLGEQIFPAESRLTRQAVYAGALLGIGEMLACGVTACNDMYYFSEEVCKAVAESGIRGQIALDGFAFDPALKNRFSIDEGALRAYVEENKTRCPERLTPGLCIHAEYTSTPERCRRLIALAGELGCRVQLHLSETASEVEGCLSRHGMTPPAYFDSLGLFDLPVTAAHAVHLTTNNRLLLGEKGVFVSHCPSSNLKLGSGFADILAMEKAGICVTLGTDGASSNDALNLLGDLRLMALLQKGLHRDPACFTALQALTIASRNGALSQGRPNAGLLEEGRDADLFALDLSAENLIPAADPLQAAVYAAHPKNVALTMVAGRILYERGHFFTIDMEKVKADCRQWATTITASS